MPPGQVQGTHTRPTDNAINATSSAPATERFASVMQQGAVFALLLNGLMLAAALSLGLTALAWLSMACIGCWLGALLLTKRGHYLYALVAGLVGGYGFALFAVLAFGAEAGFQYYLFAVAPLLFFVPQLSTPLKLAGIALTVLFFVLLNTLAVAPWWSVSEPVSAGLALTNAVAAFVILTGSVCLYQRSVTAVERQLCQANEQLALLASHDPLTGLLNRREMAAVLAREMSRAERSGQGFAIVLVDVDNFKGFNDTFGHSFGDRVLRSIATTLRSCSRASDHVARWGGEEFLLLLPETQLEGALCVAEKMRRSIAAETLDEGGCKVTVTATVGLGWYHPGDDLDMVIARADRALYAGKRQGKNRVMLERQAAPARPGWEAPAPQAS